MRLKALSAMLLAPLLSLALPVAHAALPLPNEIEFQLNRMAAAPQRDALGTQVTTKAVKNMRLLYDFSVIGGTVSTKNLKDQFDLQDAQLPGKIIITGCYIDVLTSFASGGSATVALSTGQTANDLKTATAYTSFTAGSILACIPVGSAATAIKLTAARTTFKVPTITIGTAALTAGKMLVHLQYIQSE